MAKKNKKNKKSEIKRPLTRHELTRWEKQKRQQHIITLVAIVFFVIILALIGFGYYNAEVKPFNQKVLRVNDTTVKMDYYLKALGLFAEGQQLSPTMLSVMADMTLDIIENNELIEQAAPSLGISVSAQETDDMLKQLGLQNDKITRNLVEAQLLAQKFNDGYIDQKTPTSGEQANVQAMLVESENVAQKVLSELAAGDNFTALAGKFSVEALTKSKNGDLGWLPKGYLGYLLWEENNPLFEQIAFSLEPGEISEPTYDSSIKKDIGYWIVQVVEKNELDGIHIKGILIGNQQEAEDIRVELESGENFDELAQKYSQDQQSKDNGGDLGWFRWSDKGQGSGKDAVIEASYRLEPGTISQPVPDTSVQTEGGYWLVKVLDKDANREFDDDTRSLIKAEVLQGWLSEQKEDNVIERYITEEQKAWAVGQVIELQNKNNQTTSQR